MKASDIPPAADLVNVRAQLKSRLSRVAAATGLADMLDLLSGTGLEAGVLEQAKTTVAGFLQTGIDAVEAQLVGMDVELDT